MSAGNREVVLVGGGHAHVLVLESIVARPLAGADVTVVSRDLETPYSGMLPGHIAGLYRRDEIHIDLGALCRAAGARLVHASATAIDRTARLIRTDTGPPVAYDIVSVDVGIAPDVDGIAGAAAHAVPIRPIGAALDRLRPVLDAEGDATAPRSVVVVGAGAAGTEVALAIRARLSRGGGPAGAAPSEVTLVSAGPPVPDLSAGIRRRVVAALRRAGIEVKKGRAVAVGPRSVTLDDGREIAADVAVLCTGARAPALLETLGLPLAADGSLPVRDTLQVVGDDDVFGAGDCVDLVGGTLAKAGVHAVRQAPILAENLRRRLADESLRRYVPQRTFLVLLSLGDGTAIGGRGRLPAVEGRWVFRWKDRIDRGFVDRFSR